MRLSINRGLIAAIVITLLAVVWMLSGVNISVEEENTRPLVREQGLTKVQVARPQGEYISHNLVVNGNTEANRTTLLSSELASTVTKIHVAEGSRVSKGQLLISLDQRDWPSRVKQAEALLEQRKLEFESAQTLSKQGLANDSQIAQARTALANAEADATQMKIRLAATRIRAPYAGIVESQQVEVGDYVREGNALINLLDVSPMLVSGHIAEKDLAQISVGDSTLAELADGRQVSGTIRYIANDANPQTRSFTVEMEIDGDAQIASGLTARILIPQENTLAYKISPALLILSDDGKLGIKAIDNNDVVYFMPVELLSASDDGIWVKGLNQNTQIITVGQGFVQYGQQVLPVTNDTSEFSATSDMTVAG